MKFSELLLRLHIIFVGRSTKVSLEKRIFHTMCLLSIMVTGYNIAFNYFTGLYSTSLIFLIITIILLVLYYLSRFRKQLPYSVIIASLLTTIMFAVTYFQNDGAQGVSLLRFSILFFLIMIVSPKSQYWFCIILILGTVWGLLTYELYHPESIRFTYLDFEHQLIERGSTITINVILVFLGLYYLKEMYFREHERADYKTKALSELNDKKTKLFSVLSHDLRTPLHSISNYLEMVRSEDLSLTERKRVEDLLSLTVNNTQEMLTNILLWSKDQLKESRPEVSQNNIASVIGTTIKVYETEALRKQIVMTSDIDENVMAIINVNMFQVIVRNLIANAIKFTDALGEIEISVKKTNKHALLTVKDSGKGISDDLRDRIFSLNIDSSYGTMNEKGVGLGLYLCKEYAQAQNGSIWFESIEQKGTTFFVQVPC